MGELNLDDAIEQLLCTRLQIESDVLMRLVAGDRRNALHEVENALGFAALLRQHRLDDFGRL